MMRKVLTIKATTDLLEKYYDGSTSVEEERILREYMSQNNLPEHLEADKTILEYFASQREKAILPSQAASPKAKKIVSLFLRLGIAASILIGIVAFHLLRSGNNSSYAYIDGKKITNMEQIKEQAFASIQSWNSSDTDPNLDTDVLIIQQLQLFAK